MRPRYVLILLLVTLAIGVIVASWNYHFRNLHTVEPGVLYRSGQLSRTGFAMTLSRYHIKTVVTLRTVRDPSLPYLDEWEADECRERGLRHVRILPRMWIPNAEGHMPAEESIREFLEVIENPENHPVLVHCFAGVHRTGVMCAVFRIRRQDWSAERAITEMGYYGFDQGPGRTGIETYLRALDHRQEQR